MKNKKYDNILYIRMSPVKNTRACAHTRVYKRRKTRFLSKNEFSESIKKRIVLGDYTEGGENSLLKIGAGVN